MAAIYCRDLRHRQVGLEICQLSNRQKRSGYGSPYLVMFRIGWRTSIVARLDKMGPEVKKIRDCLLPTVFLTILVACGVSNGANNERSSKASQSDRDFQEQVLTILPEYTLNARIIGGPVRVSDVYAVEFTSSSIPFPNRDEQIWGFLRRFESTGVGTSRIYFQAGLPTLDRREYWEIDFAGCQPNACIDALAASRFERISREEFDKYYRFGPIVRSEVFKVHAAVIDGVAYEARATAFFDSGGRIFKYYVTSFRDPITRAEARIVQQRRNRDRPIIPTFRYANNLVLKIDAQTWDPVSARFNGVEPLRGL